MQYSSNNKGYTLLFAVVVSSIVLAIAAFILSVSRKQFILVSAARDSSTAFYGADSGIECSIEAYNNNGQHFGTAVSGPVSGDSVTALTPPGISCGGNIVNANFGSPGSGNFTGMGYSGSPIQAVLPAMNIGGSCILLIVSYGIDTATGSHKALVDSRGYSTTCTGNTPKQGPRTVERAIRLKYLN